MNHILSQHLDPVIRRLKRRRIAVSLALAWTLAVVVCLGLFVSHRMGNMTVAVLMTTCIATVVLFTIGGIGLAFFRRKATYLDIAQRIENEFPELDSRLVTAVEQAPSENQAFDFLQQEVIRSAVYHDYQHGWEKLVPRWQSIVSPVFAASSLVLVVATLATVYFFAKDPPIDPQVTSFNNVSASKFEFVVEPGNTSVESGSSLLVLARFSGITPPTAVLHYADLEGNTTRLEMQKSLSDPVFAARINIVDQPIDYFVQLESQRSDVFRAEVFEYPELRRADATLNFPEYTKQPAKTVQDFRRISAVQGTTVHLVFALNKAVASATLVSQEKKVDLQQSPEDPSIYVATMSLFESARYELQLTDTSGRKNVSPPRFRFNVLLNQIPKINITAPKRDVQVSPIEELFTAADVWDDFGIVRAGISYMIPGSEPVDVVLGEDVAAKKKQLLEHLIEFEALNAKPDQALTYYYWAEDIGPNNNIRRTSTDMFFVDVQPFEEIYRQGQQPNSEQQRRQQQNQQSQQASQNARQAGQLADKQKELINATWSVIRREETQATDQFKTDVQLLRNTQEQLIGEVDPLAQRLTNPESKAFAQQVKTYMQGAVKQLQATLDGGNISELKKAILTEQLTYQALLKLRAREHEIVRNNQRQQQQGQRQNQRQQQQMQQLQLQQDENRYQTERQAQTEQQENPQQREDRQVLNRLRELARRQNDLNKRIKELQSALEQAKTEQEKKEIEKRLKRLQEEQEQVLRDTDELNERMNQSQNQERMSEESRQLEQARENARKAAESLQKGEVSRAAAEGSRAEQQFEELRDEFQKRSAEQFSEQVRKLQQKANELNENQKKIRKQMEQLDKNAKQPQRNLENKNSRKELTEQIDQQKKQLEELKKEMRKTIEDSEQDQPLLAQQLYDTFRKNQQSQTDQALNETKRSLQQGWDEDAKDTEQRAAKGIESLKQGIDQAAESVLGDPTESLRKANAELEQLKRELESEINRNDPSESSESRNQGRPGAGEKDKDGKKDDSGNRADRGNQKGKGKTGADEDDAPRPSNNDKQSKERQGKGGDSKSKAEPKQSRNSGKGEGQQKGVRDKKNSKNDKGGKGNNPGQPKKGGQGKQAGGKQSDANANDNRQSGANEPNRPPGDRTDRERRPNQPRSLNDETGGNQRGSSLPPINRRFGADDRDIAPLTGEEFREWLDRLRDVEELVNDPELRAEAARLRDRAKAIRRDYQRHSQDPNWDLVRTRLFDPLVQLQSQVQNELIRKSNKKSAVPLDRDNVPPEFEEAVRRYYQRIGSGN